MATMSPEHRWLVVIPADYAASQARVNEVMRPRLEERFPNDEFTFVKPDAFPGPEDAPEVRRPTVVPLLGTVGSGDSPGEMRERPSDDVLLDVQGYVDFLDLAILMGEP